VLSFISNYILISTQLPDGISSAQLPTTASLFSRPVQSGKTGGNRQAGKPQPTLPLQVSPRCPTTTRAGESQVVTVKGSEQLRAFYGRGLKAKSANHCSLFFPFFFFYLLGTLPNRID